MSSEGVSGGNDNVRSMVDRRKQHEIEKRDKFYEANPDLIDYSKLRDPETERVAALDALALEVVRLLRADPRVDSESLAEEYARPHENPQSELEGTSHGVWIQEPVRFYVIADLYLREVDAIAERVVQQNLESRFPRRVGEAAKPRVRTRAPTEYLIELLRTPNAFLEPGPLEDVAFEYRRRRMNGVL